MKKIRFGDMRWPEIDEVLKKSNVVLLPVGSTEQHGRHLPVNFDFYSAAYLAEKAARRVTDENNIHVLVAPTIPYGETFGRPPFEKQLPGSITISADTLIRLVEDVVRSLVIQGFKNILVLNGHLENVAPIEIALREITIEFKELKGLGLYATNWFFMALDTWAKISKGGRASLGHAGENETSVALAIEPENVQLGVTYEGGSTFSLPPKYVLPVSGPLVFYHSRVGGVRDSGMHVKDPNVATKETGEKFIAAVIDELAEIIVGIAKSEGMTHEDRV